MEATIYNTTGAKAGSVTLPESIFGLTWNADLVHQVAVSMRTAGRTHVAHTKDRSEVRGGGKKPWQQKGLGRARHGSSRSPIWVGGGVAHGPRNDKNFDRKINKKMKAKALFTILSRKFRDGEVLFVDSIAMKTPKTKDAISALNGLSTVKGFDKLKTKRTNAAVLALSSKEMAVEKSFNNIKRIEMAEVRNLNPLQLLNNKFIVFVNPTESINLLQTKLN